MSRYDTLTFVNEGGECWAVYRDWKFRVEKRTSEKTSVPQWHTWFVSPEGNPIVWQTIGPFHEPQGDRRPWTVKFHSWTQRRVIKKAMKEIDRRIDEELEPPKWPEC